MIHKARIARLYEAVSWCELTEPRIMKFRSDMLRPPAPLLDEPIGFVIDHGHDAVCAAVADLSDLRLGELVRLALPEMNDLRGRVLVTTAINESVVDGAASAASAGWFDTNDLPPWDTWFAYARLNTRPFTKRHALFAFVPQAWEALVEQGIRANPVDCIQWASDEDLSALATTHRPARPK